MLVLSRRVEQEIIFPHLGITISVLQVRGRIVKIGVVAPNSIKVLRREVATTFDQAALELTSTAPAVDADDEHRRRNQLNLLQLRLEAIQSRVDRGEAVDVESTLAKFLDGPSTTSSLVAGLQAREPSHGADDPIRLLVVEDCDNERSLMAQVLASQGFVVHVARDGNEAFEQLISWGTMPDFVLMDMHMPLADGAETLQRLRCDRRLSKLKVFAVTGMSRSAANEPEQGGWDGWFQKPLDVSSLVARLRHDHTAGLLSTPNISA